MPADHKDYSGTPLAKKLGIREGARLLVLGAPAGFEISPMPNGVETLRRPARDLDVALLFVTRRSELERRFAGLAERLVPDGRLWVAWPKKASKLATDLTFETVQAHGLGAGLVDNKSASIDEAYQGLQFVIRVRDRAGR
jgi:hypothetical protein